MVDHFELVVFGLLVAVAGLVLLSDVLEVPYPIFLVLGCTATAAASAPPTTPVPPTNGSRTSPLDLEADGDDEDLETRSAAFQRLRRELLEAEREAVLRLRSEGRIGDEVMRRVERDLDLEDSRLEI